MEYLDPRITSGLSFLILLLVSCLTNLLSKKINFPYTTLLVIVGILLVPFSKIDILSFIDDFRLTPDIVFFMFLPVLTFDGAYNMDFNNFKKSWKTISILAVFGVVISAIVIAVLMYYLFPLAGYNIPFIICLLFGAIISGTDPVSILSIFHKVGAPKRLTMIFEGESLFNDGIGVAMFYVILGIIGTSNYGLGLYVSGSLSFLSMIIGGILFGLLTGYIFSKSISKINYNQEVEITLSILSAYITYFFAEIISRKFIDMPISPIIATATSSMVLGNYGRYKINPKSAEHMSIAMEIYGFIVESLVFISIGLIFSSINIDFSDIALPVIFSIIATMAGRYASVYLGTGVVNIFKMEKEIPSNRRNLLFWGGLRGVLEVIMVVMIPNDLMIKFGNSIGWSYEHPLKDFLLGVTLGNIVVTLLINVMVIFYIVKKLGVEKLHSYEKIEYSEWQTLTNLKIIDKLKKYFKKGKISKEDYLKLKEKYQTGLKESISVMKKELESEKKDVKIFAKRIIYKYALGIQKYELKNLFFYQKINEKNFKYILTEIDYQIEKLGAELKNENSLLSLSSSVNLWDKITNNFSFLKPVYTDIDMYIIYRTRKSLIKNSIKEIEKIPEEILVFDEQVVSEVIAGYEREIDYIENKKEELLHENKQLVEAVEKEIINKSFLKLEEKLLNDLYMKEVISDNYYLNSIEEIENKLYGHDIGIKNLV